MARPLLLFLQVPNQRFRVVPMLAEKIFTVAVQLFDDGVMHLGDLPVEWARSRDLYRGGLFDPSAAARAARSSWLEGASPSAIAPRRRRRDVRLAPG